MKVFQVKLKVFLLNDIKFEDAQSVISSFIDKGLGKNEELLKFHNSNEFKYYCFDNFYPIEKDGIYKKEKIYTITLRSIDKKIAEFFNTKLVNEFDLNIKGLNSEVRIIPKKHLDKIYSITPIILKNDGGYWKSKISFSDFERRLKDNIIKKYNNFMKEKLDEDFQLYTTIELKNRNPISTKYKNIKLLGDKVSLNISDDKTAQELAYMCIGTGLLEMNARGFGFCNYRYL